MPAGDIVINQNRIQSAAKDKGEHAHIEYSGPARRLWGPLQNIDNFQPAAVDFRPGAGSSGTRRLQP